MIQLNLLPDVKLQYIRARQRKRMVMSVSFIASAFFIAIFLILFMYVRIAQPEHLKNLNNDIVKTNDELKAKQDLSKILTIQNQLNSLPALHEKKVISSRLFDYLTQLTPIQATISDVNVDFSENKLTIKGNADELSTVNKFADTLKFTGYLSNDEEESSRGQCELGLFEGRKSDSSPQNPEAVVCRAFGEVVLTEFTIATQEAVTDKKPISYDLTFKFDPKIFANIKPAEDQSAIILEVPKIISTRSITEKPAVLFKPQPEVIEEGGRP
ncbi:hypothetical protein KY385_03955 [Candidatus Parcubacteria bacterium]|nr:hypothetical protein [Candidatus Parcubacteria bacterium]